MSGIQLLLNVQNSYDICTICFNSVYQPVLPKVNDKPFTSDRIIGLEVGEVTIIERFLLFI